MAQAEGRFQVGMVEEASPVAGIARHSVRKTFSGGLEGAGEGEMLSHRTHVAGSAGTVLIERVAGRLDGRDGAFLLQHHGTMRRGAPALSVIPDSGTGGLEGLAGEISIDPAGHAYVLRYDLPG